MNRVVIGFYVIMSGICAASLYMGWSKEVEGNKIMERLQTPKELRKMLSKDGQVSKGEFAASYFLIAGSLSGQYKSQLETFVTFSWQIDSREYAISTLNINKIRVSLDNTSTIPTVRFYCIGEIALRHLGNGNNLQGLLEHEDTYAVITCKPSDWPEDIKLPLNN